MSLWELPLFAVVVSLLLHAAICSIWRRIGFLDFPERYGLTRARLPYPVGIAAPLVFLPFFIVLEPLSARMVGVCAAILLLVAVSFIDDRRPLPPAFRLAIQLGAALLVVLTGDCVGGRICSITNPFGGIMDLNGTLPLAAVALTVVWLLLTTNALNWFDGIPGQVNILSVMSFTTIGLLALSDRVNQPSLALLSFILAGIALGSAVFDIPPPRAVMGDTGAMFYGFLLGVLTIYAGGKVATAFLVLGVPLIDSGIVILRRILAGKSPLKGSARGEHLHHRLLEAGWSPYAVIAFSVLLGTAFGLSALFMNTVQKILSAGALLLMMVLVDISARRKKA